ncbi:hypothetical protein CGCF413_v007284 [Colletotrichum fructicola]|nr:hypothetical protein CGCF413_v007284 [Colletotrichum fructicola]
MWSFRRDSHVVWFAFDIFNFSQGMWCLSLHLDTRLYDLHLSVPCGALESSVHLVSPLLSPASRQQTDNRFNRALLSH